MPFVVILAAVVSGSLYVSSLCSSGLRALLLSLPALSVGYFLTEALRMLGPVLLPWTWRWLPTRWLYSSVAMFPARFGLLGTLMPYLRVAWVLVLAALVITLALANHRTVDRSARRLSRQSVWIVAYLLFVPLLWDLALTSWIHSVMQSR